jgi:NAD(P)H-hydrate epimerase
MIVLSPERMQQYDAYAIKTWGIPSAVLMENAGRSTYRLLKQDYLGGRRKVVIFCGRGNNGGDGFVIARYAYRDGLDPHVFLLGNPESLKGDASLNMELYRGLGGKISIMGETIDEAVAGIRESDIVVDAIFGTGLTKEVQGRDEAVIEEINRSGRTVVAVDMPSGLDGLKGVPLGNAVMATHTYTYGHPKIGQLLYPGVTYRGRLTVVDISLPASAADALGIDASLVDGDTLRAFYRKRPPDAHKGMFGDCAVVAGSMGKVGAAVMATLAALKVGAGLVTLVTPGSLIQMAAGRLTEAMTYPVEDEGKGFFTAASFDEVRDFVADKDVVILGPGLGRAEETMAFARRLYVEVDKDFVIDADGINAFDGHSELLKERKGRVVLTPHPGEFGRLTDMSPKEVNSDRMNAGRRFVEKCMVNMVLKGTPTITFSSTGEAFINPTGNPALSKGGSGDILTGLIGGLAAQGYPLKEAAMLGVYLHGYIADTWRESSTDMDMLAGDLIPGVGPALRDIWNGTDRIYVEKSL